MYHFNTMLGSKKIKQTGYTIDNKLRVVYHNTNCMRQKQYLNNPTEKETLTNMSGEELIPNLKDIVNISKNQKIQDVLNSIRYEDFENGYSNEAHIKVLRYETKDKLSMNYEPQNRILIES